MRTLWLNGKLKKTYIEFERREHEDIVECLPNFCIVYAIPCIAWRFYYGRSANNQDWKWINHDFTGICSNKSRYDFLNLPLANSFVDFTVKFRFIASPYARGLNMITRISYNWPCSAHKVMRIHDVSFSIVIFITRRPSFIRFKI